MSRSRQRLLAIALLAAGSLALPAVLWAQAAPVGSWRLWSVNGLSVPSQLPEVGDGGFLDEVARMTFGKDDAWSETTLDSLVIELLPDGAYRATSVKSVTYVVTAPAWQREIGRPPPGGGAHVRDRPKTVRHEAVGTWRVRGDSIVLEQTRDQLIEEFAAAMREARPGESPAALRREAREAVDRVGEVNMQPRYAGVVRDDRLELRDPIGRQLVLRR